MAGYALPIAPAATGREAAAPPAGRGPLDTGSGLLRRGRTRLRVWAVLPGILGVATVLRLAWLGRNSVWFPEAFVAWLARAPWSAIPSMLRVRDAHPPFYYLLMKGWVAVAGPSEAALRLPSAVFGILAVMLTYVLARRVSTEPLSLLSAFLVAVSPFHVMAAQDARMYALLSALAPASTTVLAAAVERRGVGLWAAYAGLSALLAYTHYLAFLIVLAHGIWVACFARRRLAAWGGAVAAVALVYVPWMPSLWVQLSQTAHHWAAYSPADLLGLLAFGGSLFGAASYFTAGALSPVSEFLLLLPFLAVLGCGVASLASDRRALGLLGLPPATTIGAMLAVSLVRPMFYPRWFSFLVPFYATFMALGLVYVAQRIGRRSHRILALLVAAVVLVGAPVLGRYYFDPQFRPYQWRAAASWVKAQARPGDFFLYVGHPSEVAFTYYFAPPEPTLTLEDGPRGFLNPLTAAAARELAAAHPRLWVIASPPFDTARKRALGAALAPVYRVVSGRDFTGVWIYLLRSAPGRARGQP